MGKFFKILFIIIIILSIILFAGIKLKIIDLDKLRGINNQTEKQENTIIDNTVIDNIELDNKSNTTEEQNNDKELETNEDTTSPQTDLGSDRGNSSVEQENTDMPKEEKDVIYSPKPLDKFIKDYQKNNKDINSISILVTKEEEYEVLKDLVEKTINISEENVHYRYNINGNEFFLTELADDRDGIAVIVNNGDYDDAMNNIVKAYKILNKLNQKEITNEELNAVKSDLRRYVKVISKINEYSDIPDSINKGEVFIDFTKTPILIKLDKEANVLVFSKLNDINKLNLENKNTVENNENEVTKIENSENDKKDNKEKPRRKKKNN